MGYGLAESRNLSSVSVKDAGACLFSCDSISDVRLTEFSCYVTYGHSKINVHKLTVILKLDVVQGLRDVRMKLRFINSTEKIPGIRSTHNKGTSGLPKNSALPRVTLPFK